VGSAATWRDVLDVWMVLWGLKIEDGVNASTRKASRSTELANAANFILLEILNCKTT